MVVTNNDTTIDKILDYHISYTNFNTHLINNKNSYIPAYRLYGIYRLACHFNLKFDIALNDGKFIKNKDHFLNLYENEELFWKDLYKYDCNKITDNNTENMTLSYIQDTDSDAKFYISGYFTSAYLHNGSYVYDFRYHTDRFDINIYPKSTNIFIKDGTTIKLAARANNILYWNIKEESNDVTEEDYYLLNEIIYCIAEGYQSPKIPFMSYEYFINHFDEKEYKDYESYYHDNRGIFVNDISGNNIYNAIMAFNPCVFEVALKKYYPTDFARYNIFLTKLINMLEVSIDYANGRKHESNYLMFINFKRCYQLMREYFKHNNRPVDELLILWSAEFINFKETFSDSVFKAFENLHEPISEATY